MKVYKGANLSWPATIVFCHESSCLFLHLRYALVSLACDYASYNCEYTPYNIQLAVHPYNDLNKSTSRALGTTHYSDNTLYRQVPTFYNSYPSPKQQSPPPLLFAVPNNEPSPLTPPHPLVHQPPERLSHNPETQETHPVSSTQQSRYPSSSSAAAYRLHHRLLPSAPG